MNLFEFLEEYFFVHFFDMEKLANIDIQFKETVIQGDELLYLAFAVFAFLLGSWLVIWLPVKGIKWIAKGGRK